MTRWLTLGVVFGLLAALALVVPPPGASPGSPPSVALSPATHGGLTRSAPATSAPAVDPPMPGVPNPFTTGMPVSVALGSPNLTGAYPSFSTPVNGSAFQSFPEYATADAAGDVWVPDFGGNRVLEFRAPITTGEAASVVLGQTSFSGNLSGTSAVNLTEPAALTLDSHGDLWVADWGNARVLEFKPPFSTGMSASLVLGQTSFSGSSPGTSNVNLSAPTGLGFDPAGDLWVADQANNRVLEFVPPFSDGMAASLVLGQTTFSGNAGGLTDVNLSLPIDVAATGSTVWVADHGNDRVVGFAAPFSDGEAASNLLGQDSFTSDTSTGAAAMVNPLSVSLSPQGTLWVSDTGKNRVLEFLPPFTLFESPAVALGQSTLSGDAPGLSAYNLSGPFGAEVGPNGGLWVTDANNNRVVEFVPTPYTVTVTPSGLPIGTSWSARLNNQTLTGTGPLRFTEINGTYPLFVPAVPGYTASPSYLPLAVNGTTGVTVAFSATSPNPYSSGLPASVVIGQPGFYSGAEPALANDSNLGGSSTAATFDANGDLWVANWGFNRVLEFVPPFTNGMAASVVLGQSNFNGTLGGTSATNLSRPDGLAFDSHGDLWVAEYGNNRVVEFVPPFTTGEAASIVLGQDSFTGNLRGSSATNLTEPAGLGFLDGTLWVADYNNNRIVGFPAPQVTGEAATAVLGQSTLTGNEPGLTATNLSRPDSVSFDAEGDAWVADFGNQRALEFPAPLTNGEAATVVLGQKNFTLDNASGPDALSGPYGVLVDSTGNVWVADSNDNRVVEFLGPTLTSFESPSVALGQGNTSSSFASLGPSGLDYPAAVVQDPHGDLWVCDYANDRVLGYLPAEYELNFTVSGLPSSTPWSLVLDGVLHSGLSGPARFVEENGSYAWSVPTVSGYLLAPRTGTAVINGANATVTLTVTPVTYPVTFTQVGLNGTATWTVTVSGQTLTGVGNGTVVFHEPNGTYTYAVGPVRGYTATNSTGPLDIQGSGQSVTVTFRPVSSSGSSPSGLTALLVAGVVALVVLAALAVLLLRRRRRGPPPPTPWTPPAGASSPPPPNGGPPPGAMR